MNEEKLKNLDHSGNLAGQVKQKFKLERDFMEKIKWGEFLGVNVGKWLFNETGKNKSFDTAILDN